MRRSIARPLFNRHAIGMRGATYPAACHWGHADGIAVKQLTSKIRTGLALTN
jgi:hypothetical protein